MFWYVMSVPQIGEIRWKDGKEYVISQKTTVDETTNYLLTEKDTEAQFWYTADDLQKYFTKNDTDPYASQKAWAKQYGFKWQG